MDIAKLIEESYEQYGKDLQIFYPGWADAYGDMPRERNLTFHFGYT